MHRPWCTRFFVGHAMNWSNTPNHGMRGLFKRQTEMIVTQKPTAIGTNNVDADKTADGKKYNINGQLVGKDFKGIYIMNGKKHLNK